MLSFTALLQHNSAILRCIVTDPNTAVSTIYSALLLVQGKSICIQIMKYIFHFTYCIGLLSPVGNLTSTEVDHCTLRLTWTAPYTLQGVSINYYTINITGLGTNPVSLYQYHRVSNDHSDMVECVDIMCVQVTCTKSLS